VALVVDAGVAGGCGSVDRRARPWEGDAALVGVVVVFVVA
jgi:hypothetical protein